MTINPQAAASNTTRSAVTRAVSIMIASMTLIASVVLGVGLPTASAQLPQVDQAETEQLDVSVQLEDAKDPLHGRTPGDRLVSTESAELNQGAIDALHPSSLCRALLSNYFDAIAAKDPFARELARLQYRDEGCEHYAGFIPL